MRQGFYHKLIIPYQELLGNYDVPYIGICPDRIIPYQELLGNYDTQRTKVNNEDIIP